MAEESGSLRQEDIDQLLKPSAASAPGSQAAADSRIAPPSAASSSEGVIATQDMELLIRQAEAALASIDQPTATGPNVQRFRFDEFAGAPPSTDAATLDLLRDVELDLKIELGRTQMYLEDILKLRRGSVVPLEKLAGDPVDIYVNGRLIARGEVLVLNDNFCVRVAELVASETTSS